MITIHEILQGVDRMFALRESLIRVRSVDPEFDASGRLITETNNNLNLYAQELRARDITIEDIVGLQGQYEFCKNCGKPMLWCYPQTPHSLGVLCSRECEIENARHYA